MLLLAVVLASVFLTDVRAEEESYRIVMGRTRFGSWSKTIHCPGTNGVAGFRIRNEAPQGKKDDTSMNGIQLLCTDGSTTGRINGYWGSWKPWRKCPSGTQVDSFNFKSEKAQGKGDDTAGNDVMMLCGGKHLLGGGNGYGSFEQQKRCPFGTHLWGVRARIEAKQGSGKKDDDTALNQLEFICHG